MPYAPHSDKKSFTMERFLLKIPSQKTKENKKTKHKK